MFFNEAVSHLKKEGEASEDQLELFNAISSIFIEFPIDNEPPSSAVVALAVTNQHLPIQQIAQFISNNYKKDISQVLSENIDKKILGFGHPSIKGQDERVLSLKGNFKHLFSDHTNFCLRMENRMPVPMNIGCIIASLSLDNGISAKNCLFLPLLGRMLGWLKLYNKTQKKFNKVVPSFENIKNES